MSEGVELGKAESKLGFEAMIIKSTLTKFCRVTCEVLLIVSSTVSTWCV